jgi:hypothetical protein
MRQRGALERALARADHRPPRWTLSESRLRLRTHRMLLGLTGGVRLHYLGPPRGSAGIRSDSRLTVRVLLAEARAARTASMHAYLVCVMAARGFVARLGLNDGHGIVARGVRAAQRSTPGRGRDAVLLGTQRGERGADGRDARETLRVLATDAPRHASLHVLQAPDRGRSTWVRESRRQDALHVLHTLALARIVSSTQRILYELRNRYGRSVDGRKVASLRGASISPGTLAMPKRSTIDANTVAQRLVSIQKYMHEAPGWSVANLSPVVQRLASDRPAALAARMPLGIGQRTLFGSLRLACLSAAEVARGALADIAKAPHGSATTVHRPATHRWLRLLDRRAHAMHGQAVTRRTTAPGPVSATAMTHVKRTMTWVRNLATTMQNPAPLRPGTPGERAAARLAAFHPIQTTNDVAAPATSATMRLRAVPHATAAHVASPSPAMPRSYAGTPAAALSYRRTPRAAVPDTKRQSSQLQQQVVRQVTQELAQNTPWRGQLEQAVLAPRVLRELTERVAGAIAGRQGLERYRRGL